MFNIFEKLSINELTESIRKLPHTFFLDSFQNKSNSKSINLQNFLNLLYAIHIGDRQSHQVEMKSHNGNMFTFIPAKRSSFSAIFAFIYSLTQLNSVQMGWNFYQQYILLVSKSYIGMDVTVLYLKPQV